MARPLPPAIDDAREWRPSLPCCGDIACYRDDAGAAAPVLLLHSINAAPSAMEVRPLFEALRGAHPVLAPDLPGFGRSPRPDRAYTPDLYSAAIRELIAASGLGPVHVVALSTAAEFAARAALEDPALVASLTLVSPTGLGSRRPPGDATGDRILGVLRAPLVGAGLFRVLRTRASIRYFLRMAFAGELPREVFEYAVATAAQPGAQYAPFHFLSGKLFTADALESLYLPLATPTLILYDEDPNVGFERLDELLAGNVQCRAQRIPNTRGLPHFDEPEATQAALQAFWSAVAPA